MAKKASDSDIKSKCRKKLNASAKRHSNWPGMPAIFDMHVDKKVKIQNRRFTGGFKAIVM